MSYIELHAHSCFSLLDGASTPEALVERAAALAMPALALTDHDAVYGAVRFVKAAEAAGIKPLLGAELTLPDDSHLTLLVQNDEGWANLCALITLARHHAPKGSAHLPDWDALASHSGGLIALTGCREGQVMRALRRRNQIEARQAAERLIDWFGAARTFIELQHHLLPGSDGLIRAGVGLADRLGIGIVATNNVHYAERSGQLLQDVLVCIRHLTSLDEAGDRLRPNSEYYLKAADEMRALFSRYPAALSSTQQIAALCDYRLTFGLQDLPTYPTPEGESVHAFLTRLCQDWLTRCPSERAVAQMAHELAVIERASLSNYFVVVWDLIRFARERGIRCQGRGSAANSLVAYALAISPINPLQHDLVFERFLSDERQVVPDIDIDFDAARREEVIQYVYERYGVDHAAMACTFITFRARSALRDVGRALGLPVEWLDMAAGTVPGTSFAEAQRFGPRRSIDLGGRDEHETWSLLTSLCSAIDGFPRHLGIHNGGMVITGTPITQRLPTEPATMPGRSVVHWDKDGLEDAGLIKIDLLGLRMISAIADAVEQIGTEVDDLPFSDEHVYGMLCEADTIGVFQVESRAQQQVLPQLQPRTFNDLIVSISLIRPGPVQGNMVHPYLRRRLRIEPVTYPHPLLEPALAETLGVILFQEQVIKTARDLAGFSPGQGERLRRALGGSKTTDWPELETAFIAGASALGVDQAAASAVFETLRAFGGYSFPKSHAAAFAVLVYQSAWLKRYHPAAFYCALLNHQPMGFWSPAVIVGDARRHGIVTHGPHVNHSRERAQVISAPGGQSIRLGLLNVQGIGSEAAQQIVQARIERGPFTGLRDFALRSRLGMRQIEALISGGALDGWGRSRRALLWELAALDLRPDGLPFPEPEAPNLPEAGPLEILGAEYAALGLTVGDHPLVMQRAALQHAGLLSSRDLRACSTDDRVRSGGMVVVHQSPPTAKGMHFITLEDEFGFINAVVRPPIYTRYRDVIRGAAFLAIAGVIERRGSVINLLVDRISPLRLK